MNAGAPEGQAVPAPLVKRWCNEKFFQLFKMPKSGLLEVVNQYNTILMMSEINTIQY
jgi:hypothetical protein